MRKRPEKKNMKSAAASQNAAGCWSDSGYNDACSDWEAWLPSEEELWNILRTVHNCKISGEDCAFTHCRSWGKCVVMFEAIHKRLRGGA